jgi:glycerol-3-phosphate acyltransferase PlsX
MARIALDAMGGDFAPHQTVLGALDAASRGVEVVLVGDEAVLQPILDRQGTALEVVDAPETIEMGEDPIGAIRSKPRASVTVAARLVAEGQAQGMVSAGSTGAALAAAAVVVGRIPGISRPAIATIFPLAGGVVLLDAGANLDVQPRHLAQFAVMGSVLARVYLGVAEPRVGLLNIGEESSKGRDLERKAHQLLDASGVRFVGNVEGRDIGRAVADVIVTDGFTGNVVLKVAEETARIVGKMVLEALSEDADGEFQAAVGTVLPKLVALRGRLDPEAYGGAHLVGVKGTVVIAHGSSSRVAVANALMLAAEGADRGLVAMVESGISG